MSVDRQRELAIVVVLIVLLLGLAAAMRGQGDVVPSPAVVDAAVARGRAPLVVTVTSAKNVAKGDRATVLFSPRRAGVGAVVLTDVPVLEVVENAYTLGILVGDLERVAAVAGVSDVRLTRPY